MKGGFFALQHQKAPSANYFLVLEAMRRDGTFVEDGRTVVGHVCFPAPLKLAPTLEVKRGFLIGEVKRDFLIGDGKDVAFAVADDIETILVAHMPRLAQDRETNPV